MSAAMLNWIDQCWRRGDSIADTRLSVLRNCGTKPSFEQVRHRFAQLSHGGGQSL